MGMARVILIWPTDVSKQSALYPPLGLASLAAVLKQTSHNVSVIDLSFDDNWSHLHSLDERGAIYGISFTSSLYTNTKKCIEIIRNKDQDAKIVLGGPHPSVLPEATLNEMDADVVCIGEAEISFPMVVDALINGSDLAEIPGIAFRNTDEANDIVLTPAVETICDLDALPIPDQSLFPYKRYFKEKGFRELSIVTSRGCPGSCTFCQPTLRKMFGRKIRYSSSDHVINQIRYLKERFKLDFFVISDDTFVSRKRRVMDVCGRIISEKLYVFWRCQTRIDLLDREMIRMLKKAGCFVIALGVESGSQAILDGLRKNVKVEKIKEVFRICHEEGMLTHAYLMIGNIGETWQTINQTKELLSEIKPFSSNICVTTPYPGTHLYETLLEKGQIEEKNWDTYDHLLSDTVHVKSSSFDLATLNEFKAVLLYVQRYPLFKLRCLCRAFLNWNTMRRFICVLYSNPGILFRGLRLFGKSLFAKGLQLSNPKTRAYETYCQSPTSDTESPSR